MLNPVDYSLKHVFLKPNKPKVKDSIIDFVHRTSHI